MPEKFIPKPWFFRNEFYTLSFKQSTLVALNKAPTYTQIGYRWDEGFDTEWTATEWGTDDLQIGDRVTVIMIRRSTQNNSWHFGIGRQNPVAFIALDQFAQDNKFIGFHPSAKDDAFRLCYFQNYIIRRTVFWDATHEERAEISSATAEMAINAVTKAYKLWRTYKPKEVPALNLEY